MHPVLGTMMPEICEAPHFSCQPRLHTQIVGMRSLHSPMTSLKTSIKTITYLSDTGCLEIQGASLIYNWLVAFSEWEGLFYVRDR